MIDVDQQTFAKTRHKRRVLKKPRLGTSISEFYIDDLDGEKVQMNLIIETNRGRKLNDIRGMVWQSSVITA